MAPLHTAFISLIITSGVLAAPTVNSRNSIQKRGFRVAAHRRIPEFTVTRRQTGAVVATNDGGGWIIPVLIGGQQVRFSCLKQHFKNLANPTQVTLNVDTGSSDL